MDYVSDIMIGLPVTKFSARYTPEIRNVILIIPLQDWQMETAKKAREGKFNMQSSYTLVAAKFPACDVVYECN